MNFAKIALPERKYTYWFFSPKCSKYRLAAGLCRDPLGSLSVPPNLLALAGKEVGINGEEGQDRGEREWWGGEGGEKRGSCAPIKVFKSGRLRCISSLKV